MGEKSPSLKRSVSCWMLIFYGLGNILGAGIYVLIGEIAAIAGIYTPLAFAIACIVVLFTALSYAELSARFPVSAGEAIYIQKGLRSQKLAILTGLTIAFSGMLSSATIIRGFHNYLSLFVDFPSYLTTLILLIVLTLVTIWGIGISVLTASFMTLLEISGLLLVIGTGGYYLYTHHLPLLPLAIPETVSLSLNVMLGAFLAFYAFLGFEDMVNIAEEVKNPSKTMPRAIMGVLLLSTLLYMGVAWISLSVLSPERLAASQAPLAEVYRAATGKAPLMLSSIALFAVINGALIQIVMVSRIFYGMSKEGWLPSFLRNVHPKTHTPIYATLLVSSIVFLLASFVPLVKLAESTSFLIFIVFTLVNLSLIAIKRKDPHPVGIRTFPLFVPIVAIVLNLAMLGIQLLFSNTTLP